MRTHEILDPTYRVIGVGHHGGAGVLREVCQSVDASVRLHPERPVDILQRWTRKYLRESDDTDVLPLHEIGEAIASCFEF